MEEEFNSEHEVTIRITVGRDELIKILNKNGYSKTEDFVVDDIYMIPEEFNDINKYDERRIIEMSVRIRSFIIDSKLAAETEVRKEIVKKDKEFDDKNNILNESKYVCRIKDVDEAFVLLKKLGYVELFRLKQDTQTFTNGKYEIIISQVNNRLYLEIENKDNKGNIVLKTPQEMINLIEGYNIPHVKDEYFAQKAIDIIRDMRNKS